MLRQALKYTRANWGLTFRPDVNCVLWLPGQDDPQSSTIRDRNGQGTNGTITGAAWAQTGQGLWVLHFNGTSDDALVTMSLSPPYTLILWAKLDILPSVAGAQSALTDGNAVNTANLFCYPVNDGFYFNNGGQIGPLTAAPLIWHMFAAVVNGASSSLSADAGTPVTGTCNATSITSFIIGQNGNGTLWLDGMVGLVRIYNRALSTTEIAGHYQNERHLFRV